MYGTGSKWEHRKSLPIMSLTTSLSVDDTSNKNSSNNTQPSGLTTSAITNIDHSTDHKLNLEKTDISSPKRLTEMDLANCSDYPELNLHKSIKSKTSEKVGNANRMEEGEKSGGDENLRGGKGDRTSFLDFLCLLFPFTSLSVLLQQSQIPCDWTLFGIQYSISFFFKAYFLEFCSVTVVFFGFFPAKGHLHFYIYLFILILWKIPHYENA